MAGPKAEPWWERRARAARPPDHGRVARDRAAEPQTLECDAPERRLNQHGGECRPGVEHSEKAHQMLALSEVSNGLGLEPIIDERGEDGGQRDHEREMPQQRLI